MAFANNPSSARKLRYVMLHRDKLLVWCHQKIVEKIGKEGAIRENNLILKKLKEIVQFDLKDSLALATILALVEMSDWMMTATYSEEQLRWIVEFNKEFPNKRDKITEP